MRLLTAAEMREADRRCIEVIGIPGAVLMNNAGAAVYAQIRRGPVGIVCGKGNNGGDGFVVARLALLAGLDTQVILLADPGEIRGDAATFLQAYQNLGGELTSATTDEAVRRAMDGLSGCAALVDAMLGTGTQGEVRGLYRTAIESWPPIHTVAVDLPSGLHTDTGEPLGACIKADRTVTFQFAKRGFDNPGAAQWLGEVIVADIGIPEICADDAAWARLPVARQDA